jgi:hypothetical protein
MAKPTGQGYRNQVIKDEDDPGVYWQRRGGEWVKVPRDQIADVRRQHKEQNKGKTNLENDVERISIKPGPLNDAKPTEETVRYPKGIKDINTDYVFFQFGRYNPPFKGTEGSGANAYEQYNSSVQNMDPISVGDVASLILPMPQDLSNELKNDWNAKSFTRLGKSAIAAAGAGNFQAIGRDGTLSDISGNLKAIHSSIVASVLNKIPGVGGNLSFNDISGSTRGIVLNPNAEILYDSPNMREIGMVFKMVPFNDTDSENIKKICDTFRAASLPSYGDITTQTFKEDKDTAGVPISGSNFISVPLLCKFTFMKGSATNPNVAQFKPCAITRVQVNYTPDGTYATYHDGAMVATELSINFLESKLIFNDEISQGF